MPLPYQLPEAVVRNLLNGTEALCEAALLDIIEDSRATLHQSITALINAQRSKSFLEEEDFSEVNKQFELAIFAAFRRGIKMSECSLNTLLEEYFRVTSIS